MNQFFLFLLKSIISSGIFFGYYCLFLRNKKFHHYNRIYLVFTLAISVVMPCLHFGSVNSRENPFANVISLSNSLVFDNINRSHASSEWVNILTVICLGVSAAMLMILLVKIIWIYRTKYRYSIIKKPGYYLIETDLEQAPFSFLNNLFWRTNISMYEESGKKIFAHELTHIKEKHSYDKLFSQVLLCFFWINPFYWFIQEELNAVHEFIADSKTIEQGDTVSLAKMLLQTHNEGRYLHPSHLFFNSYIKRRIIMLTKSKSDQYSGLRRVCSFGVLVWVTFLLSFKTASGQIDPKLNPHDSVKIDKVSIHPRNDSVADVAITYIDVKGKPTTLNLVAGYSKNDSSNTNIVYDEESGERREVSVADTREIVKQIIQNPPAEDIYFVDGAEYSVQSIKKLNPNTIKTINRYTGDEAIKRYGEKARKGVFVFTTK